jgi:hypothetical protein
MRYRVTLIKWPGGDRKTQQFPPDYAEMHVADTPSRASNWTRSRRNDSLEE